MFQGCSGFCTCLGSVFWGVSALLHALAELPRAYQDAEDLAEEANESTDGDREIAAYDDHQQAQNHHHQFEIVQTAVEEVRTSSVCLDSW